MNIKQAEKLQKILANAGFGSRREIETWISAGRVTVNAQVAKLGDRASLHDKINIDGKPVKLQSESHKKKHLLMYHKPIGEICTRSDTDDRPTVFDRLPKLNKGRWIIIGRLDINSCGLLLFTNDGEFANQMMHPSSEIERRYAVRVLGEVDEAMVARLKKGVQLEDGLAKFMSIHKSGGICDGVNQWYHVSLCEGRKREVRRLFESQGLKVNRLIRIGFGPYELPKDLKPGHWIEIEA